MIFLAHELCISTNNDLSLKSIILVQNTIDKLNI